jgi:alkylation response protein AidB-like acyl-CoA dehydrogenase
MMNKLSQSNFAAAVAELSNVLIEDDALVSPIGNRRPGNERWVGQYMNSLAAAIAGGTSNIQRNIIAERGLELPRESVNG